MNDDHITIAEPYPQEYELLTGDTELFTCGLCGSAIVDKDEHDQWHGDLLAFLGAFTRAAEMDFDSNLIRLSRLSAEDPNVAKGIEAFFKIAGGTS